MCIFMQYNYHYHLWWIITDVWYDLEQTNKTKIEMKVLFLQASISYAPTTTAIHHWGGGGGEKEKGGGEGKGARCGGERLNGFV